MNAIARTIAWMLGVLFLASAVHGATASLTWIPQSSNEDVIANAISDDGSTVVGYVRTTPGNVLRAFRWTASTGRSLLGDLPGGRNYSVAYGVSGDGSVVTGASSSLQSTDFDVATEPFRWTATTGMQGLGFLPGTTRPTGEGRAVSGDGLVVVGVSSGDDNAHPFRWTAASGMTDLGGLDRHGGQDIATATNVDGSVVVGMTNLNFSRTAFRWTPIGGMQSLGSLVTDPNRGEYFSFAEDASADGSVVVGNSYTNTAIEAFRWTEATGMTLLDHGPGGELYGANATGISSDGRVITGYVNGGRGVLWDGRNQVHDLKELLIQFGLGAQLSGYNIGSPIDISADGRTITGNGYGPGGSGVWVATIPELVVPEPSSVVMASSVVPFFWLAMCGRRRGRAQ